MIFAKRSKTSIPANSSAFCVQPTEGGRGSAEERTRCAGRRRASALARKAKTRSLRGRIKLGAIHSTHLQQNPHCDDFDLDRLRSIEASARGCAMRPIISQPLPRGGGASFRFTCTMPHPTRCLPCEGALNQGGEALGFTVVAAEGFMALVHMKRAA